MANTIPSPNMNLPIPIVGQSTGPDYALNVDACFMTIDGHDHSNGFGVQITPAGLNINADLPLNNNDLTAVRTVRFQAQSSVPAVSPDLLCFYTVGNDVYFNDGAGNVVRITQSGSVTGSSGTITGLPSGTASAAYSAGSGKFVFQSASNTGADLDGASLIIREKVASGHGITLSAPGGLAADYALTLPSTLPGAQKFATIDSSGNIAAPWAVDNSTLEVSGGTTVQAKDAGITTAKLANLAVTNAKLAAPNYSISSSTSNFSTSSVTAVDITNANGTITTVGKSVEIFLVSDGTTNASYIQLNDPSSVSTMTAQIDLLRDGTKISSYVVGDNSANLVGGLYIPSSSVRFWDNAPSAASHTYKLQVSINSASNTFYCFYSKLIVREV